MKIEVPRKTAYYKKKQAENILNRLGFTYFFLRDDFWDFLVVSEGNIKLVKVVSSKADVDAEMPKEGRDYRNFDREVWRFSPFKQMPDISKFAKEA